MRKREPEAVKTRLLVAAADQLARGREITLLAVAKAAGVSKGGLLHHYPNKDALTKALVNQALDEFEANVDELAGRLTGQAVWCRAFFIISTHRSAPADAARPATVFLRAAALNPVLMDPVRTAYRRWTDRLIGDAPNRSLAALVRAAADGVCWADAHDLEPPDITSRAAMLAQLEKLLSGEGI